MRRSAHLLSIVALLESASAFLPRPLTQAPLSSPNADSIPSSISSDLFDSLTSYAQIVDIAYCVSTSGIAEPFQCLSWCMQYPHFELIEAFNTGALLDDAAGFVALDHDPRDPRIIGAFRGTYNIGNTITDLSTMPQKYVPYIPPEDDQDDASIKSECGNCTVHAGFLASWQKISPSIVEHIKSARSAHPNYSIHLVGHSLGGAMSLLAALDFQARGWPATVTTFGEPRVGNADFVDFIDRANLTYRRVTHEDDPVPLLPPTKLGYVSHGNEIFIKKKELPIEAADVIICDGNEDERCSAKGDVTRLWELFFSHRDYFIRMGLCTKKDGAGPWDGWFDGNDDL